MLNIFLLRCIFFLGGERVARARQAQVVARAGRSLARMQGGWRRSKWWHWQGEALHGSRRSLASQPSSRPARHEAFRLAACAPPTHATRTCLRHHVLILESVTQPPCQRLIWDETRVIHTTALVVRPDVRPRKLPRRRARQKDVDKAIAIIHVVHGGRYSLGPIRMATLIGHPSPRLGGVQ